MALTILPVKTRKELKQFIRFNYELYKENPYSVPDLYEDTMNTLRNGSKGTQVKVLQWLLNLNGYDAGTIDGVFGKKTKAAVEAYQKANGLEADGIVGKKTWTKLLA